MRRAVGSAEFLAGGDPATPTAVTPADEVAFWLYSSGSTGAPKGVRHVHGSLRTTADTYGAQVLQIRADDLMFSAAKAFHAYGLGNSHDVPDVGRRRRRAAARPADARCGAGHDAAPSADDLRRRADAVRIDAGQSAHRTGRRIGAAAPLHLRRRGAARRYRPALVATWSAWTSSTASARPRCCTSSYRNRADDIRYGTSGKPVPGYDAMILDEHGGRVPNGEAGELVVRGPSAAEGYWNQRDKTRRTFRGEWTHTGDTYIRDEDGYYRFCGRTDEMLKVSGVWVSPFEVEEALVSHPAVLESAVVGAQDRDGLTKPKAFVVLQDAARRQDAETVKELLKTHVKERIGVWKYPRWIEFVDGLPKTATGKIQRFRLRDDHRP